MFIYEKFRSLCTEKKLTPYQVSIDTGVSTATLSSWKQGKYIPKADKVQKLADYFEVPITYFLEN